MLLTFGTRAQSHIISVTILYLSRASLVLRRSALPRILSVTSVRGGLHPHFPRTLLGALTAYLDPSGLQFIKNTIKKTNHKNTIRVTTNILIVFWFKPRPHCYTMRITKHITFFFIQDRIKYINAIISEVNNYNHETDIFIHTNVSHLAPNHFVTNSKGKVVIVYHDLSGEHPYKLSWKCRALLAEQKSDYDIFIYCEDDILIPSAAIEYWNKYNHKLIENGYNLGFMRIETYNGEEFISDLPGVKLDKKQLIDGELFSVNDKNPYCAFWIYNKNEFNKFVNSLYYSIENIPHYDTREKSAIGLHGVGIEWYKATVIPIYNGMLTTNCKVYHLPNNYVNNHYMFATIKFNEALA